MPLTKVTTAITAATPMTTPSRVRIERSLFAHSDSRATRMASRTVTAPTFQIHDCIFHAVRLDCFFSDGLDSLVCYTGAHISGFMPMRGRYGKVLAPVLHSSDVHNCDYFVPGPGL